MAKGIVYICHHIDTEGPMWENIEELFDRISNIFNFEKYGIDLLPTYEIWKSYNQETLMFLRK